MEITIDGVRLTAAQVREAVRVLEEKEYFEEQQKKRDVPFLGARDCVNIPVALVRKALAYVDTYGNGKGYITLYKNGNVHWNELFSTCYYSPFKGFKE